MSTVQTALARLEDLRRRLTAQITDHTDGSTSVHGIADTADLVTLDGTQTLTNKTISLNWVSFTPSWTNITLGTGATNTGQYCVVPGGMHFEFFTQLGTSPSVTGIVSFELPGPAAGTGVVSAVCGSCHFGDASSTANDRPGVLWTVSSTAVRLTFPDGNLGTTSYPTSVLASGDVFSGQGFWPL